MRSALLFCFALLLCLGFSGCTTIPTQEMTTFREAFLQAKAAGTALYDELGAVIAKAGPTEKRAASCNSDRPPTCFDPNSVLVGGGTARDPAIQARIVALDTVVAYTLAVSDLIEGKSQAQISSRIDDLAGLATDLAALAGSPSAGLASLGTSAAVGSFKQLASRLEKARAAAAVRQSLHAESPVIAEIIDLLIADTKLMYDVYFLYQGKVAIRSAAADRARETAKITQFHESLTAYVLLLASTKRSLATLNQALDRPANDIASIRAVVTDAADIKTSADKFWKAVRELHQ